MDKTKTLTFIATDKGFQKIIVGRHRNYIKSILILKIKYHTELPEIPTLLYQSTIETIMRN